MTAASRAAFPVPADFRAAAGSPRPGSAGSRPIAATGRRASPACESGWRPMASTPTSASGASTCAG